MLNKVNVPTKEGDDHEIEVGLKETIIIAVATTALSIATAASIHAMKERSKRKTYKSLADSVGSVVSKFIEVEVPVEQGHKPRPKSTRVRAGKRSKRGKRGRK